MCQSDVNGQCTLGQIESMSRVEHGSQATTALPKGQTQPASECKKAAKPSRLEGHLSDPIVVAGNAATLDHRIWGRWRVPRSLAQTLAEPLSGLTPATQRWGG